MHGCSDIKNILVVKLVADILSVLITHMLHYFLPGCPHLVGRFLVSVFKHIFSGVGAETFLWRTVCSSIVLSVAMVAYV